jgi:hypothetical protein
VVCASAVVGVASSVAHHGGACDHTKLASNKFIWMNTSHSAEDILNSSLVHLLPALADEAAQLGRGVARHRGPVPVERHAHDDLQGR